MVPPDFRHSVKNTEMKTTRQFGRKYFSFTLLFIYAVVHTFRKETAQSAHMYVHPCTFALMRNVRVVLFHDIYLKLNANISLPRGSKVGV